MVLVSRNYIFKINISMNQNEKKKMVLFFRLCLEIGRLGNIGRLEIFHFRRVSICCTVGQKKKPI